MVQVDCHSFFSQGLSAMTSFACLSGCGLRARRDGSCSSAACTNFRPSMRGACRGKALHAKHQLITHGSPSFKVTSRRIRGKSTPAALTPAGPAAAHSPRLHGLLRQSPLVPSVDALQSLPTLPTSAVADVSAAGMVITAAVATGDSRARLRCAVLARLSSLSAVVGDPRAFHVMGACLAVVEKSPRAARLEPLSLWVSAVLQVGWALMGSSAAAAPDRLWRSSEPRLVQEAAISAVMNWVGGCSVSLPFVEHQS